MNLIGIIAIFALPAIPLILVVAAGIHDRNIKLDIIRRIRQRKRTIRLN